MKKLLALLLAAAMVFSLVACGETENNPQIQDEAYVRANDDDIYYSILEEYENLVNAAEALSDPNERFVVFAQAEALLLDSAVMIPTTTQGGNYAISRLAPKTIPYAQWGNDEDRYKNAVIASEFIKSEDREAMKEIWAKAVAGEAEYDPAAFLTEKGYSLIKEYVTTFTTAPVTLDWLNTSSQADTEILVNCVDGLVQYNNLGQMIPSLAESWEKSEDGTVYTFHIRPNAKWFTAEGTEYANVTAKDFVAGFRHMLDAKAGLEWLVDGVIVGATDYYNNGGAWENVGYEAVDDYTLKITLEKDIPYFLTMLTYSCFMPMCDSFYQSHGGVYGVAEYKETAGSEAYTFGKSTEVASQVYCSAFLLKKLTANSEIVIERNAKYWDDAKTTIDKYTWIITDGSQPAQQYKDTVDGKYTGIALGESNGTLALAKEDGNFDKYQYITETTSTSYFGGLNLNRGTYELASGACKSSQTGVQKNDTHIALMNKNFRKAITHAFDKAAYNAVSVGEDLATAALRNMYTHPEFVQLSADVTDEDGHTFSAGTMYGEMVQYYIDKLGAKVIVKDGVDGWFNPDAAKEYLAKAVEELGDQVAYPIIIDVVYLGTAVANTAQAQAYKKRTEETLGSDKVVINLIEATTQDDFYACGYRAADGKSGLFDMFYGSGWGPDYGDPSTYLDTFKGQGAGYMTKVIGLY